MSTSDTHDGASPAAQTRRQSPKPTVGHDYSQGYGPEPARPGSGGRSGFLGTYELAPQLFGSQPGVPVGFVEAIQRFYAKYAQFSGRASHSEYWWIMLYTVGVAVGLSILSSAIGTSPTGEANALGLMISLVMFAFGLVNLVPGIAVTVRRLHDVNLSGWFYLLACVPLIGGLVLLVILLLPPKPQGARFDL